MTKAYATLRLQFYRTGTVRFWGGVVKNWPRISKGLLEKSPFGTAVRFQLGLLAN